jgi:hypothetical protein
MSFKGLFSFILVLVLSGLASTAVFAKGTPDGETPANEAVCEDVFFATPGLYGLCVAFCEAQDCEATFDPATGEVEYAANCKTSSPRILANYNRRKSSSDPSMPCVNEVANECPCWTEAELDAVADGTTFVCGAAGLDFAQLIGFDGATNALDRAAADTTRNECFYQEQSPSLLVRPFNITDDEADVCLLSLLDECDTR